MYFTYLNLGALGLTAAVLIAVMAVVGLIYSYRQAARYARSARSLDAVRTAAGGTSRLGGKLLGMKMILAAVTLGAFSSVHSVAMFPVCQRTTQDTHQPGSSGYLLCCNVVLPEQKGAYFSRTCQWL